MEKEETSQRGSISHKRGRNVHSSGDGELVVRKDLDDRVVDEDGEVEGESLLSDDRPELQLSGLGGVSVCRRKYGSDANLKEVKTRREEDSQDLMREEFSRLMVKF